MEKKDYEKYIQGFYDINPDDLESECIKVIKAFYTFSALTAQAYADQLVAKDEVKKVSARAFMDAKTTKSTDNKAKEMVQIDPFVIKAKKLYLDKLKVWEDFKAHKETTVMKKEMLVQMGFNRKVEAGIENHT